MIGQKELTEYVLIEARMKDLNKFVRDLEKKKKALECKFIAEGPLGTGDIEDGELTLVIREDERAPRLSKDNVIKTIGEPAYEQLMGSLRLKCVGTPARKFVILPENESLT